MKIRIQMYDHKLDIATPFVLMIDHEMPFRCQLLRPFPELQFKY